MTDIDGYEYEDEETGEHITVRLNRDGNVALDWKGTESDEHWVIVMSRDAARELVTMVDSLLVDVEDEEATGELLILKRNSRIDGLEEQLAMAAHQIAELQKRMNEMEEQRAIPVMPYQPGPYHIPWEPPYPWTVMQPFMTYGTNTH